MIWNAINDPLFGYFQVWMFIAFCMNTTFLIDIETYVVSPVHVKKQ